MRALLVAASVALAVGSSEVMRQPRKLTPSDRKSLCLELLSASSSRKRDVLDLDSGMIETYPAGSLAGTSDDACATRATEDGCHSDDSCDFLRCQKDSSVDAILAPDLFGKVTGQSYHDLATLFKESRRIIRPDGRLVVTVEERVGEFNRSETYLRRAAANAGLNVKDFRRTGTQFVASLAPALELRDQDWYQNAE